MNRPKSRSKRSRVSLVRSESCRSDVDLSDDNSSLHISVRSGSNSPANDVKPPLTVDETGTLSDTNADVLPTGEINKLRIRNGFKLDQCQSPHKDRHDESKSIAPEVSVSLETDSNDPANNQSTNLSKTTKLHKSASASSDLPESSLELSSLTKNRTQDVNLPPFEESIIEGFSIMAFNTASDLELYSRLTDKNEETPSRRTSSRSASAVTLNNNLGRQRRCTPRSSIARSKKGTVHNTIAANGPDADATANKTSNSSRGNDNKGDSVRLGPLHIDITSPTSTTSSGRKSGDDMVLQRNDAKENGLRISNGEATSVLSADKTFPVLLPKNNSNTVAKSITTSSAPKRDLFSIAALTAVEENEEASPLGKPSQEQHQSQIHLPQLSQPPQPRQNGHLLTPAQWLERLSCRGAEMALNKGGFGVAEEELRQLTHLLFTDRGFTEQVARLPPVAQIMAFYHQQQQEQLRQQHQRSQIPSSCSPSTVQSFAKTFNPQQNSVSAGVPPTAAMDSSVPLTNKAFPPSSHPPLPFTPPIASSSSAAVVSITTATTTTTANRTSSATNFPTPVNSTPASVTTPIHPPPLPHSPAFFNSTAVAAALAAGLRSTAPVFQGQAQSLSTGQFLPAPSISTAGTSIPSAPPSLSHHPFMANPPHLSTLWSHHHLPRLQPPAPDFPYLLSPHLHPQSVPPSSNPANARKAMPVVDAVDLTSMAGGGNGVGNMKRSAGARLSVPQSLLNFPNFWAHQRSPVAIATPIQQPQPQPSPSASRRPHQLPRFRDLFRIEGVLSNRGATAHLRICYHIMMDKTHGLKSVNPSNPWWYVEPSATLSQPKPRERPPPPPHLSHHQTIPRFPNYEQFMRTALGGGGASGNCAVPSLPPHPIAIDLTRSPPPHLAGLAISSVRKPLQHPELPRSVDPVTAVKLLQQQRQQQQQETELMMALKRRRVMPEGGSLVSSPLPPPPMQPPPQLLPPPHYQNGGIRMPLSFPFSPSHFRHPL